MKSLVSVSECGAVGHAWCLPILLPFFCLQSLVPLGNLCIVFLSEPAIQRLEGGFRVYPQTGTQIWCFLTISRLLVQMTNSGGTRGRGASSKSKHASQFPTCSLKSRVCHHVVWTCSQFRRISPADLHFGKTALKKILRQPNAPSYQKLVWVCFSNAHWKCTCRGRHKATGKRSKLPMHNELSKTQKF